MARHAKTATIVLAAGLFLAAGADADTSVQMLREHGESMNLQRVVLRGVVHLISHRKQELGGTCGGITFLLEDETGSIEISVRRSSRLLEPVRDGDRVLVVAQVEVVRNKHHEFLRTCVMANEVEHLHR
jgi:hypothetical protein